MTDGPRTGVAEGGGPPGPTPGRGVELRKGEDRVLLGVCSGLGEYTGVDPVVWRAVFVLTAFAGATGLLLYLLAWMLMRDTVGGPSTLEQMLNRAFASTVVLKLLALGLLLATALSLVGGFGWGTMVLATPLIIGLLSARNRGVNLRTAFLNLPEEIRHSEPAPSVPDPERSPSYYNPAQPWASASPGPVDLAVVSERASAGAGSDDEDQDEEDDEERAEEDSDDEGSRERCRTGAPLASIALWTFLGVAVLAPVLLLGEVPELFSMETLQWLVGPDTGVFFLSGALALVGVLSLVGSRWGNTAGLWGLGVVLALLAATASVADLTRVGWTTWEPREVADLREGDYRLTLGSGVLDLRGLEDLEPGDSVSVQTSVNGSLRVLLPEDARVEMDSWIGLGRVREDEQVTHSGAGVEFSQVYEPADGDTGEEDGGGEHGDDANNAGDTDGGDDGEDAGPPVIELRTDSYVGQVEVQHGRSED